MVTLFSTVGPPWWDDRPVILVGTGPSLTGFDLSRLRDLGYILAVKEAVWDLPFADACFGLDYPWMRRMNGRLSELAARMPLYLAVAKQHPPAHTHVEGAIYLERDRKCGPLSDDPGIIEAGANSGFGAFNLAYLKHANLIYLFGFDYTSDHYCPERYAHHGRHHAAQYWPRWARNFERALPQLRSRRVRVINASPISNIDVFPKVSPNEAIEHLVGIRSQASGSGRVRGGASLDQKDDQSADQGQLDQDGGPRKAGAL